MNVGPPESNFLKLQPFQMTLQNLVLVWLVGAPALFLAVPVSVKSDLSRQQQTGTSQVRGKMGLSLMHFRTFIQIHKRVKKSLN